MDIPTLRSSSALLSAPQLRQAVDTWRVGQVLQADVVSAADSNSVTLKVGDLVLTTQGALPQRLRQGVLQLQVQSLGPQPTLRVISPLTAQDAPGIEALRLALPRQLPLPPLLANLAGFLARSPEAGIAALPRPVLAALEQLVAAMPDAKQLASAGGVARALQDSGLFLERKLRGGKPPPDAEHLKRDFKAALLRTAAALQSATSPMAQAGKSTPPGTRADELQVTAAAARAAAIPATATPSQPNTAAMSLRTYPAGSVLPVSATGTEARTGTAATTTSPRPSSDAFVAALPPLRGGAILPQGRVEPTITNAMPLEIALRQLADQLEGAVARLTTAQASQLNSEENPRPLAWTFELPVRHQAQLDVLGVRIERDDEDNNSRKSGSQGWNVTLSFDFPETGAFYAQLRVHGKVVTCRFTAEREPTLQRLQQELKRLDQSLRDAGLEVGELRARQGTMPRADSAHFGPLLDLQA